MASRGDFVRVGPDDGLSDDNLIARFVAGDAVAWRPLVLRHAGHIQRTAWLLLRDRAEAEDVTQETFLRLLKKAPDWRPGEAQLKTWLHRVAVNLCIDRRRRGQRVVVTDAAVSDWEAEEPGFDRTLDIVRTVGGALAQLPDRQRAAIVLVHYQGMTNIEAASILSLSVDALESLLARGRRRLRALIGAEYAGMLER